MNKRKAKKKLKRQLDLLVLPPRYSRVGGDMDYFISHFQNVQSIMDDPDLTPGKLHERQVAILKLSNGLGMDIMELFFMYHEQTGYPLNHESHQLDKVNYDKMPTAIHRDNKEATNKGNGWGNGYAIRVPSLKRNKNVWRNFYNLFPQLKGKETFRGYKLKKID